MLGYLSADIILPSSEQFCESVAKTVSYEDKYPSIFSPKMEAIVFIILQFFFRNARSFENWGNLSNRSSGVQIPRDICTRFGRYLYFAKCSWIIMFISQR